MKFTQDETGGGNVIQGYARGRVVINGKVFTQSLIVTPSEVIDNWRPTGFDHLNSDDFTQLAELAPEIVILGTGAVQRFPHPSLSHPLISGHIGMESMTTAAACRTYNILMGEGRRVAAALLMI